MERILLVDTELAACDTLARSLGPLYEIVHAETGASALPLIQRQPVALVILEQRLPDMSGLDLLARIKAIRPQLPAIMVTACGSEWVCAAALKLGARDYFIKPVESGGLVASIRLVLSAASRPQERRRNVLVTNESTNGLVTYRPADQPRLRGSKVLAVRRAVRFLHEHYWDTISLQHVACQLGMSPFVLSRKFKAAMNVSFRRYLLNVRVMKAQELLQAEQYSITEIAQLVGFSDLPRFDKVFKQIIGVPPSTYRAATHRRQKNDKPLAKNY